MAKRNVDRQRDRPISFNAHGRAFSMATTLIDIERRTHRTHLAVF
jgi:hypothetical protein